MNIYSLSRDGVSLRNPLCGGAGMAQWLEHLLPTNVSWVRSPDPVSNVG